MKQGFHIPVLLEESIGGLNLKKNSVVIDATIDGAGHAREILKKLGRRGRLIGLDWDPEILLEAGEKFRDEKRVKLFHLNFRNIGKLAGSLKIRPDAIFFDLGLSSLQLQASGRGFSFQRDEPLLMTFDPALRPNAREFLKRVPEWKLKEILRTYGEERGAGKIARAIIRARAQKEIRTSEELARIIEKTVPRRGNIHPATRTFQALRIFLNQELENLEEGLAHAFVILSRGGRIAVISFHSLEDRIVKRMFVHLAGEGKAKIVTRKPIRPSADEILENPRSRSAKLRIIEKL